MDNSNDDSIFTPLRPNHYHECAGCSIATERISRERSRSIEKNGRLDTHQIEIDCHIEKVASMVVMWAIHNGSRYPKGDSLGLQVIDNMLIGGENVHCPGFFK